MFHPYFAFTNGDAPPPPTPTAIPAGGAGHPVNWQGKRRKATLEERPNEHLKDILNRAVAEMYGELVEDEVPKVVKHEAGKLVRPYVEAKKQKVPQVERVDWSAFEQDAAAVRALMALWQEQFQSRRRRQQHFLLLH